LAERKEPGPRTDEWARERTSAEGEEEEEEEEEEDDRGPAFARRALAEKRR